MSLCITSSSNIRIFEDKSADLTRQTYEDGRFDKSTIRHRIFEYSGLTESEFRSLVVSLSHITYHIISNWIELTTNSDLILIRLKPIRFGSISDWISLTI